MKRTLALILALVLCLSLTACVPVLPVPTTAQPETAAPTAAPTEAATEAPATTEAQETALAHGIVEGNTYTNETLNFKFTVPEGWIFYTEDQIAAQNNLTVEMFEGTAAADALKQNGQLIDMMAAKLDGSNASLVIQPAQAMMAIYSDKQLFELLEETYKAQFKSSGLEIKEYEVVEMPALGTEKSALRLVLEMSGVEMTEYQVWLRDNPDYYGVLTITTMADTEPEALMEGISNIR